MALDVDAPVPEIHAPNQHGEEVVLDRSGPTLLCFYPEDGTPGCTTEIRQFEVERDTYESAGVAIYGVSTDGVDSHAEFAAEHDIGFDLLADPDGEIAEAFGVDTANGTAERTTFVLDEGMVLAVYEAVDPDGHAREVGLDLHRRGLVEFDW